MNQICLYEKKTSFVSSVLFYKLIHFKVEKKVRKGKKKGGGKKKKKRQLMNQLKS